MDHMDKERLVVAVRKELLEWIDHHVTKGRFANRSAAVEYVLAQAMDREMRHRTAPGVNADE